MIRIQLIRALIMLGLNVAPAACTSYRIIRYREPDARNQNMFPHREVRHADTPFQFARAQVLRNDLDTISVRIEDGSRVSWGRYMATHAVLGFLVVRNDTIIYERYREGMKPESIHSSFSVAKSVLSALVGAALADGSIRSLDDKVTYYLPEFRGNPAFDGVTVRNLLEMKSGLRYTEAEGGMIASFKSDEARIYYASNLKKTLAGSRRIQRPGTTWVYKDTDAELLGLIVAKATGKTISRYTEEKVWRKIGTEYDAKWDLDRSDGQEKVSSGFNATARDFARFARLYLNGGQSNGVQVLPAEWVGLSVSVDTTRREPEISTWWQMQHSYYWWHPLQPPHGDFFADGSHGQRIYIDPETKTIIVQLANDSRQDFPFRRITAYLSGKQWTYPRSIPALLRQTATSFGADSIRPVFNRLMRERTQNPEAYVITARGMRAAGTRLAEEKTTLGPGIETLILATEYSPKDAATFLALSDAYVKAGDRVRAAEAIRHARDLAPSDPEILRKAKMLGSASDSMR